MERKQKIMTETPVIVREYSEDVMPKPLSIYLDPYVLHDPSIRDITPKGHNLVPRSVRDSQKDDIPLLSERSDLLAFSRTEDNCTASTNDWVDSAFAKFREMYPYLNDTENIVIDTKQLRGDKYYNLYFLSKNGPKQVIRTNKVLNSRTQKAAYFAEKLSPAKPGTACTPALTHRSASQCGGWPKVVVKKNDPKLRPKGKTMRIQFYGTGYDATRKSQEHVRRRINPRITTFQTKDVDGGKRNSNGRRTNSPSITLKTLFDKGDPIRLLSLVSPHHMNVKKPPKVFNTAHKKEQKKANDGEGGRQVYEGLKAKELDLKRRKELITKYGGNNLEYFASPLKVKKLSDMPDVFQNIVNWNLAKTYQKMEIGTDPAMSTYTMGERVGLVDVEEKLFTKLEKIETLEPSHKRQVSGIGSPSKSERITTNPADLFTDKRTPAKSQHLDILSTKDSVANDAEYYPLEKKPSGFTEQAYSSNGFYSNSIVVKESGSVSKSPPCAHKGNFCLRCALRSLRSPQARKLQRAETRTAGSAESRAMEEEVQVAKKKAADMIRSIRECTKEKGVMKPELMNLSPRQLELALSEKKNDACLDLNEKNSSRFCTVRKLILTNRENELKKGYKVKVLARDKAKLKLPLDNRATQINERFKSKPGREKIDAVFSAIFHQKYKSSEIFQQTINQVL